MATTLCMHQLHTHVTLGLLCRAPHNARVQRHRSGFLELQSALQVGIILFINVAVLLFKWFLYGVFILVSLCKIVKLVCHICCT